MTLPRGVSSIKPIYQGGDVTVRPAGPVGGSPTSVPGPPGPASTIPGPAGPSGPPGVTGLQQALKTTDASGNATFTFSPAYGSPPDVSYGVENTGSEPIVCNITALDENSVTIHVWQAQNLPAIISTLSDLQNFDIFGGTGISGVNVHIIAVGT